MHEVKCYARKTSSVVGVDFESGEPGNGQPDRSIGFGGFNNRCAAAQPSSAFKYRSGIFVTASIGGLWLD
jgi:hypothetical protein